LNLNNIDLDRESIDDNPFNRSNKSIPESSIIKAYIVHCVPKEVGFKYPDKVGSLLVLVEEFGTRFWIPRNMILNYDKLNFCSPGIVQSIEVKDIVLCALETYILQRKEELLTYKKR